MPIKTDLISSLSPERRRIDDGADRRDPSILRRRFAEQSEDPTRRLRNDEAVRVDVTRRRRDDVTVLEERPERAEGYDPRRIRRSRREEAEAIRPEPTASLGEGKRISGSYKGVDASSGEFTTADGISGKYSTDESGTVNFSTGDDKSGFQGKLLSGNQGVAIDKATGKAYSFDVSIDPNSQSFGLSNFQEIDPKRFGLSE